MYLFLDIQEIFFLVHVVLYVGLLYPCPLQSSAFPGEVPRFVAVVTLSYWGCHALGVLPYLGHVSLALLFELGHVPSSLS